MKSKIKRDAIIQVIITENRKKMIMVSKGHHNL